MVALPETQDYLGLSGVGGRWGNVLDYSMLYEHKTWIIRQCSVKTFAHKCRLLFYNYNTIQCSTTMTIDTVSNSLSRCVFQSYINSSGMVFNIILLFLTVIMTVRNTYVGPRAFPHTVSCAFLHARLTFLPDTLSTLLERHV